jgi:hypothetical protein
MAWYVFKRFGEVDPDRAHAKLTHERLADLPVPRVDFADRSTRRRHDAIVAGVERLLSGQARLGRREDLEIEMALRELWGLSAEDGAYIHEELARMPDSQALRDLFPDEV